MKKKPSRGKRHSQRSPHSAAPPSKFAPRTNHPAFKAANPAPNDISPAIAFLLCLKTSPAPAQSPRNRTANRATAIAAPDFNQFFSQDDRATLALLTLPVLLMISSLAITQSLKPLRRVDLAAVPATIIPPAAITRKSVFEPALAPVAAPNLPLSNSAITPAANPSILPANPGNVIASSKSPVLAATPAPTPTTANGRTAMLAARPPVELDTNSSAALPPSITSQPIPSQEANLDIQPKLCTARPATPPLDLTTASLTPAAFGLALATAARAQTHDLVIYNDKYRALSYPRGDVQPLYGVCTDVIIRAYRALGIDLQQLVHESRLGNSDTSIDHRRTETLRRFFAQASQQLPPSTIPEDYLPGDIVTYDRPQNRGSRSHIAIVSDVAAPSGRYMIVHNRGWGPQLEDGLFVDTITGHYRYSAPPASPMLANIPVISAPQKRPSALTRLASRAVRRLDGTSVNGLGR